MSVSVTNTGIGRRDFLVSSVIGTIGLNLPLTAIASSAQAADSAASPAGAAGIRKFNISIPDSDLDDLRRHIGETRWPDRETVPDTLRVGKAEETAGFPLQAGKHGVWRGRIAPDMVMAMLALPLPACPRDHADAGRKARHNKVRHRHGGLSSS
ncbi:hypothetical protein IVA80_07465 [Bradyrhizobium sp. 139]|uniref:hypothetical protein n=1 Tax=Bradyrhizobium sp. 139 TaxID=2782616 RepID=UPI001FFB9EB4|nr:hypothetical protein [Bradyrhizobium sp. 139]MCK1740714.1 hypothetical protein [Bradyrhizobium sp. 139]